MRSACLLVILSAVGCATRIAPIESGHWDTSGQPPQNLPAFSIESIAGEYASHSPGGGTALTIGKDGRWSCHDVPFMAQARNYGSGKVRISGESVVLEANDVIGFPTGEFVVLTLVKWGDRRYLLAPGEFAEFCNHINWGFEPERGMWGRFFLLDEGAERANIIHPVKGPPELPEKWLKAILSKPVAGVVQELLPGGRIRVNVGSADGVFEEMDLRTADEAGRFLCFLRVFSFTEHECVLEPSAKPEYTPPQVGWKVYCNADGAAYAPR
jgi:hypothetical protein